MFRLPPRQIDCVPATGNLGARRSVYTGLERSTETRHTAAMTLQVIGAGFGRTGTTSLKAALEELGFSKCHHMEEVMKSGAQVRFWQALSDSAEVDWDEEIGAITREISSQTGPALLFENIK